MIPFHKRLSTKFTLYIFFIVILPAGITLALYADKVKNDFRQAMLQKLALEMKLKADRALSLIGLAKGVISAMALDFEEDFQAFEGIKGKFPKGDATPAFFKSELYDHLLLDCLTVMRESKYYLTLRLFSAKGKELIRFDRVGPDIVKTPQDGLQNKAHRDYFQHFITDKEKDVHIDQVSLKKEHGRITIPPVPMLRIGKKVYLENGDLFGVVVLNLAARMIFGELPMDEEAGFLIIDDQGTYLRHWDKTLLFGKDLGHAANLLLEEPELKVNLGRQDQKIHYDPELNEYRVWKKVFFDKRTKSRYWVFMERRCERDIVSPWTSAIKQGVAWLGITLFFGFILIIAIMRRTTLLPLSRIHEAIESMESGDLSTRVAINSTTEIGHISHALNSMANKLGLAGLGLRRVLALTRSISDIAPNAHIVINQSGEILSANPATEKIFGYSPDELVGQNVKILTPSPHRERHDEYLENYLKSGVTNMIGKITELAAVRKNGEPFPANIYIGEAKVGEERVFVGIIEDITKRKRYERAIRDSERQLRDITSTLGEAVVVVNEQEEITFINPEAERILGWKAEELMGENPHRKFHYKKPDGSPFPLDECAALQAIREGTDIRDAEDAFFNKDGGMFPVRLTATAIKADGKINGGVLAFHDITNIKRAEERIKKAKEAAEVANRAKSEFLAAMSHEIRTPMNAVIGMAGLLKGTDLTSEQDEYVDIFKNAGENLLQLLNDILDISKIEAGRLELEEVEFDLRDLLEKVGEMMAMPAHSKGIELVLQIKKELPSILLGDPTRLRQILNNLVGNAVKFTKEGEVVLRAETREVSDNSATILFSVRDTGIGIPTEKQEAIFNAFQQADSSTTRKYGGTGLGLPISKRLVDIMGGKFCVESREGEGSAFHFTLEFKKPEQAEKEEKQPYPYEELAGKRALVVDDNATNRATLRETLSVYDISVTEAEHAEAAMSELKKAKQRGLPFDFTLIDHDMPGMDGLSLTERLLIDPEFCGRLVLMLTSTKRGSLVTKIRRLEICGYLVKPVKISSLCRLLTKSEEMERASKGDLLFDKERRTDKTPPLRILLAEDDHINQKVTLNLLHKMGHEVELANNGEEALKFLEDLNFDLVLMDVNMPEMDGFEATRIIRKNEKKVGGHIPIIAITALAFQEDRKRCLNSGMDDFCAKPIRPMEITRAITRLALDAGSSIHKEGEGELNESAGPVERKDDTVFDKTEALDKIGNDAELLAEIAQIFISESTAYLKNIKDAVRRRDSEALTESAHKLKGAAANLRGTTTCRAARNLEVMGKESDFTEAEKEFATLEKEIGRLKNALREFVKDEDGQRS